MNTERCASCLPNPPFPEDVIVLHLKTTNVQGFSSNHSLHTQTRYSVYFHGLDVERELW